ncbi:hypothetical protein ACJJTC_002925 [Scirpophaga incertulas]
MLSDRLSLFYQNVRGLRTKTLQFRHNIFTHSYDIILITETWLVNGIYKGELCDDRYDVFRCDRNDSTSGKKTGGGVMICTRQTLQAQGRPDWACADVECVWVTVPKKIIDCASAFARCESVLWSPVGPTFLKRGSTELQNAVIRFVEACNLSGLNQQNYHKIYCNNILDLIFSDTPVEVSRSSSALIKEDKYHPSLVINASDLVVPYFKRRSANKLNFYKADYDSINRQLLSTDWDTLAPPAKSPIYVQTPVTAPPAQLPIYVQTPVTAPPAQSSIYIQTPVTAPPAQSPNYIQNPVTAALAHSFNNIQTQVGVPPAQSPIYIQTQAAAPAQPPLNTHHIPSPSYMSQHSECTADSLFAQFHSE